MDNKKYSRIAGFSNDSIVDGPGIRFTIFYQGCKHHCKNCHNPETWNFEGGNLVDNDDLILKIKSNPLLDGVTLSGGDPMFQIESVIDLCEKIKTQLPELNIILYTGYTFEELQEMSKENKNIEVLQRFLDYIVDGRYIHELRDLTLHFKGSSNQRVIDVKKTLINKNSRCKNRNKLYE